jgi:hypothetical protein
MIFRFILLNDRRSAIIYTVENRAVRNPFTVSVIRVSLNFISLDSQSPLLPFDDGESGKICNSQVDTIIR